MTYILYFAKNYNMIAPLSSGIVRSEYHAFHCLCKKEDGRLGRSPGSSSAQVVPGSGVLGTAFHLGLCVAKRLPKMVPAELSFGGHLGEIRGCLRISCPFVFICFFLNFFKIFMSNPGEISEPSRGLQQGAYLLV